jgi:hypothetical protein
MQNNLRDKIEAAVDLRKFSSIEYTSDKRVLGEEKSVILERLLVGNIIVLLSSQGWGLRWPRLFGQFFRFDKWNLYRG